MVPEIIAPQDQNFHEQLVPQLFFFLQKNDPRLKIVVPSMEGLGSPRTKIIVTET